MIDDGPVHYEDDEPVHYRLAGTPFHKAALKASKGEKCFLKREPGNAHDSNAVAVYIRRVRQGQQRFLKIGYIPKGEAVFMGSLIKRKKVKLCKIASVRVLRHGGAGDYLGIGLHVWVV